MSWQPLVVLLLLITVAHAAIPTSAADDEAPTFVPFAPDTGTLFVHASKDFACSIAGTLMADVPHQNPLLYATNVQADPCARNADDLQGSRSVLSTAGRLDVHVIPTLDQPLELVTGAPITATVWMWTEGLGTVAPRFELTTTGWSAVVDAGPIVAAQDIEVAPGGVVWHRFDLAFGAAPAAFGTGHVTLSVVLNNDGDELRHVSLFRAGLGTTGDHRSILVLPVAVQVDEPDDPVPPTWPPPIERATVRPGVQHFTAGAQCTTNFVFRDHGTGRLYMGTAAHCVDGVGAGGISRIGTVGGGTSIPAKVVFSTYWTNAVGSDFALMEIPVDREQDVHPAVLHFGGPTHLAEMQTVNTLDKVVTFGNSGLRPGPQELDRHEGYVTGRTAWFTSVYTVTPGIFGDSGSGIMTEGGGAIGAASTIAFAPIPGENRFGNIPPVIDWLNANGWDLELQTWDLLAEGILPAPFD